MAQIVRNTQNMILASIALADFRLLEDDLESVDLPLRKILERRNRPIDNIFFPESGLASVVANGSHKPIEVGVIGREGMTGISVLLGGSRPAQETFMQVAGRGHRLKSSALRKAMEESRPLHRSMLLFVDAYLKQVASSAAANGRGKLEERMARWLLMAADRLDGPGLSLTQDFLAMMLAVRRPGVTVAFQELERRGVISRKRGSIFILDRHSLEKLSNGTYMSADFR